ncbi:drug/metabolite transporter (DMT)-like permease [Paracoccus sulfuroxidans]|uniref:Drug/metabolite transporter (DMT)-like permease n=2 Tax=Paracoccus sulfuroxidans TaxID=384678 RepID=A0A562NRF1_9RHOB|nr:drug/metabolite transporter (DMT)-like permease [Paracoccus sulfuroxidans]
MRTPLISPNPGNAPPAEQVLIEQTDNDNLQGAMLMIACMAVFACNDALIKYVTQELPLSQAIVMRGAFVLPLMLALGLRQGRLRLRVPRRDVLPLVTRSLAEVSSSLLYLLALRQMPLGNISAIMQSLPLAVMLGAAVFFRERMGWRRIGAVLVGFAGVLVVLRPGTGAFDEWAIIALLSVVLIVVRDLVTRKFSGDVGSSTVAFYAAFAVMMSGFVLGFEEPWRWPTQRETLLLLLSASFLTAGYITAVASMRVGEISFVAPFRYTSLIAAILLGLLVFGEWPDLWTWVGAAMIVGAGIYAILRDGKARRAR